LPLTLKIGAFRWSASWFTTLLTAVGIVLFILLGRWQWHRAQQSQVLQTQFLAGTDTLTDLAQHATGTLARYARVRVRGQYDGAHQFLLDNMSHDGAPGYEVLTPLTLADGRALIVNRGWVPITESRRALPDVALPAAAASATAATGDAAATLATPIGRLDNLPVPGIALGHAPPAAGGSWPKLTSFPTMADLSAALGRPLEPRQLLLDAAQPQGYVRDWKPPGMSPAQHLSYAIQWWLFATLAALLYALLNRRRRTNAQANAPSPSRSTAHP
jgi:surfeit locus 1 family protein